MKKITIHVPQLGEGLQEARIVKHLKRVGDRIAQDEPLFQMETDKAVVEIESTVSGVVEEWLCKEGETLEIGASVVSLTVESKHETDHDLNNGHRHESDTSYALKVGSSWRGVPFPQQERQPRESRARLDEQRRPSLESSACAIGGDWTEISAEQAALIRHMTRGQSAIPATVERQVKWPHMRLAINAFQERHGVSHVTTFEFFALAVSRTASKHPRFRSHMVGAGYCTHDALNLGVAVALPNDELSTAVISGADRLSPADFIRTLRANVRSARRGADQANAVTQLHISSLGSLGIDFAIPILVPPAIGTIFFGTPTDVGGEAVFNIVLTFDHRAINGVGAALFLRDLSAILVHGEKIE